MREKIIEKVLEKKIVAIVRGLYGDESVALANALYEGGIELLEVTFDQAHPEKFSETTETIKKLVENVGEKMIVGAGTVTSLEMLEMAHDAGAQFIVSPDTNEAVIKRTVELGMVSMPGAMTATEVLKAYNYGADFVKVFPISNLGVQYIKALRSPINHIKLLAVGGVDENNISDYMRTGVVGVGIGGNLVNKEWIQAGEFDKITKLSKELVKKCNV